VGSIGRWPRTLGLVLGFELIALYLLGRHSTT
jgi:hypothetical protein